MQSSFLVVDAAVVAFEMEFCCLLLYEIGDSSGDCINRIMNMTLVQCLCVCVCSFVLHIQINYKSMSCFPPFSQTHFPFDMFQIINTSACEHILITSHLLSLSSSLPQFLTCLHTPLPSQIDSNYRNGLITIW